MKINSLKDLLIAGLQDLYDAQRQVSEALPVMTDAAFSRDLRMCLADHFTETTEDMARVEKICNSLGENAKGGKCRGMKGVLAENEEMIRKCENPMIRDAVIVECMQKIAHYEIAEMGCARSFARQLGLKDVADLLQEGLTDEKDVDKKLTAISQQVNAQAALAA